MALSAVIGALRVNLGLDSAQFSKGLKDGQKSLARVGRQMQVIGGIATAGVGAAFAGVTLAVRGTLTEMDGLAKTARKLGVPVEELQRLRHAAELSGVSANTLDMSLQRFTRRAAEAANGTGEAKDALDKLGVQLRNANGTLRPASDLLNDVADAFTKVEDPAERVRLAFKLFDSEGVNMVNLLAGGSAALRDMKAEADALGIVFSEDAARSAEEFNDNITRLGEVFTGLKTILAAELAPVLADLSGWFAQNGPMIVEKIRAVVGWFKALSPETKKVIAVLAGLTAATGPVLVGLGTLAVIVGTLGAPVLLFVAALAGVTAALVYFKDEIAAVIPSLDELWQMLKDDTWVGKVAEAINLAVEHWSSFKTLVSDAIGSVRSAISDFGEWIASFLPDSVRRAIDGVIEQLDRLTDVPGLRGLSLSDLMQGPAGLAGAVGRELGREAAGAIPESTKDAVAGDMKAVGTSAMEGLRDGMLSSMSGPIGVAQSVGRAIGSTVADVLGIRSPSRVFRELGEQTMAGMAQGIGDGASMPLDKLQAFIDDALAQMERLPEQMPEVTVPIETAFDGLGSSITEPLKQAFKTGELSAGSFKDTLLSIMVRLRDALIDQAFKPIEDAISRLFDGAGQSGGGGGGIFGKLLGGLGSIVGGLFGGGGFSTPSFTPGPASLASLPSISFHANGGVAEGWAMVGERGRELMHLGSPSRVFSNSETDRMLGGGGTVVNVYAPPGSQVREERSGSGGMEQVSLFIEQTVAKGINRPGSPIQRALSTGFGARPVTRER